MRKIVLLIPALLLPLSLTACGNKGKLVPPSKIKAEEKKTEENAAKENKE